MIKKTGKTVRILLLIGGTVSLVVGIIGIFLPLLPTTPFLLITAFCYAKGSERLYNWLKKIRWLYSYIENYREGKGIRFRIKAGAIIFLWAGIITSILIIENLHMAFKIILIMIAIAVSIHIILIRRSR